MTRTDEREEHGATVADDSNKEANQLRLMLIDAQTEDTIIQDLFVKQHLQTLAAAAKHHFQQVLPTDQHTARLTNFELSPIDQSPISVFENLTSAGANCDLQRLLIDSVYQESLRRSVHSAMVSKDTHFLPNKRIAIEAGLNELGPMDREYPTKQYHALRDRVARPFYFDQASLLHSARPVYDNPFEWFHGSPNRSVGGSFLQDPFAQEFRAHCMPPVGIRSANGGPTLAAKISSPAPCLALQIVRLNGALVRREHAKVRPAKKSMSKARKVVTFAAGTKLGPSNGCLRMYASMLGKSAANPIVVF